MRLRYNLPLQKHSISSPRQKAGTAFFSEAEGAETTRLSHSILFFGLKRQRLPN
jgi:hypothetical protein